MDTLAQLAPFLGGVAAVIAVVFSVVIHYQTRNLMRRVERPIMSLQSTQCSYDDISKINVDLTFKNIGKHPAGNLHYVVAGCRKDMHILFEKLGDWFTVDRKDPGSTFTAYWKGKIGFLDAADSSGASFLLYISMDYEDIYDPSNVYSDSWYQEYKLGQSGLDSMHREDYLALQPYMESIRDEGDEKKKDRT